MVLTPQESPEAFANVDLNEESAIRHYNVGVPNSFTVPPDSRRTGV